MNRRTYLLLILRNVAFAVSIIIVAMLLCSLFGSCTTTKYVPVESVRTEYRDKDNTELLDVIKTLTERLHQKERQVDSLMQSHNELLVLNDKGDTLRHDRETIVYRSSHRETELERLLEAKNDSLRYLRQQLESIKADTIPVPYPVEKPLSRWEQTKMDFGGFALGGIAVALCIAVVWLIRKFRR